MTNPIVSGLFRAIPFRHAVELHQKLVSNAESTETRRLLQEAMRRAGLVSK